MTSALGYMQLCRLCLVKDKVNVPIFGKTSDVQQLFLKISSCLPVKISEDDNLPKNICQSCMGKVDLLYQFWNTTVNSEKQLVQWLEEIGVDVNMTGQGESPVEYVKPQPPHSIANEIVFKQEIEHEGKTTNAYNNPNFPDFQMQFASHVAGDIPNTFNQKQVRQTRSQRKTTVKPTSTVEGDSGDEESGSDQQQIESEDDDMSGNRVAKVEADSEDDYDDASTSLEPTFVGVPTTSTCDTEQPGPSGLNKSLTEPGCADQRSRKPQANAPLKCDTCGKQFDRRKQLTRHKRRHRERVHPCKVCGKKFVEAYEVALHQKSHSADRKFSCDVCTLTYKSYDALVLHKRRHTKDFSYKCGECDKGFFSQNQYKVHYDVHHQGVRFQCTHCEKSFIYPQYYKQHLRTHEPGYVKDKNICEICNKEFSHRNGLRTHMRTHTDKQYMCDVCGTSVSSSCSLTHHKRIHSGEKPFKCSVCGKCFSKNNNLRIHRRVHSKEKPYNCERCDKNFTQRSSLVIHMRHHTGERPYKCDICQKDFVTKTLMRAHSKVHGVPIHCKTEQADSVK